MQLKAHGKSDVGRVRSGNEDRYLSDVAKGLFAVSDGMGGHQAGEIASRLAIETLSDGWGRRSADLEGLDGAPLRKALLEAAQEVMLEVCAAVYEKATTGSTHAGMGATLTFVAVRGGLAVMGHVGDTRLYLVRDGKADQLSADHTLAAELLAAGVLDEHAAKESSHAGVLTRSLGSQRAVQIDRLVFEIEPGDRLVLCSDGVSRYAPTGQWIAERAAAASADELAQRLVAHANESGGEDNATALVVELPEQRERPRSDMPTRVDALAQVAFLSDLGLPHRTRLAQAATSRQLGSGEPLVSAGEAWCHLVVVCAGSLLVVRDGRELGELPPGSYAGVRHVVSPGIAAYGLKAAESTEVVLLDHKDFTYELHVRPWLGTHVLENLAAELAGCATPGDDAIARNPVLLP